MNKNACPVCGSNKFFPFLDSRDIYCDKTCSLLKCMTCGLVKTFVVDKESHSEITEINTYPAELNYRYGENQNSIFNKIEFYYINRRWKQEVKLLKRYLKKDALLLDIGAGSGLFLKALQNQGIRAEGIDKYIDLKMNGLKILPLDIEKEDLPYAGYDCVTMYHSLEHMKNPSVVLKKIRDALNNGGMLLLQVPNIASWQFRIFRKRWFHLFLPFHIFHYSTDTLTRLLENNGFSIIHIRHFSNRWNVEGWSASVLRWNPVYFLIKKAEKNNALLQKFVYLFVTMLFIPFALVEAIFKRGGVITVVARKRN